jgi:putative DNA methylase
MEAFASDLNPVAVLINKAMIEIPPKFGGRPPVNPKSRRDPILIEREWRGAQGLSEDVRYYGKWIRDEAEKRIGHLYPKIDVTSAMAKTRPDLQLYVGQKLTVIAWLWTRTVKSPNPAFANVNVPLASTFMLSAKSGKEAYVDPIIEDTDYRFTVKVGKPKNATVTKAGTKSARGANFRCLMSGTPIAGDYIKAEGKAGRLGARLMAIVAEGERGRVYLEPTPEHEAILHKARPDWKPEAVISGSTQYIGVKPYGIDRFDQLFTNRQLVALTTISDLVSEAIERIRHDIASVKVANDDKPLVDGGTGARAYAEAVGVFLTFALSKVTDLANTIVTWRTDRESSYHLFSRQAIPISWDYCELNVMLDGTGSFEGACKWTAESIEGVTAGHDVTVGQASQLDATVQLLSIDKIVSTDPPYYDNVPYADLSDFFYVWLRRSLRLILPDLFATLVVPKSEELVAFAYRHQNGKAGAEAFFVGGMTQAMDRLAHQAHPAFPVTIYYAFKQAENGGDAGTSSTGWETFLDAVIAAGFATTGTWPMRTELGNRMRGMDSNALASSIVLVCRPRHASAPNATRGEFVAALKAELPQALTHLQAGNIAPVDLAQAAIGPGMAVYTRYARVVDATGEQMKVREALALINQMLDEALADQEGDFDADSRWALAWYEQNGFAEAEFGEADVLARAKNTSVDGMQDAGILVSRRGKVRLLRPEELPSDWDPEADSRLTAWEVVHHLIRVLEASGEDGTAPLVMKLGSAAEVARELAYRLYTLSERKKRAREALSYNSLVQSWPEIVRLSQRGAEHAEQSALFEVEA